jgi:hypothetical protein
MEWTIENVVEAIGFGVPVILIPLSCFFCSIYAFDKRVKRLFAVTIGVFIAWLVITAICVWLGALFAISHARTIWPLAAIYFGLSLFPVWVLRSAAKSLTLRSRADRPEAAGR